MSKQINNIDNFLKSIESESIKRLGAINQSITNCYFNKKPVPDDRLVNYLSATGILENEAIGEMYFQVKKNIDENFKKFLMPFLA